MSLLRWWSFRAATAVLVGAALTLNACTQPKPLPIAQSEQPPEINWTLPPGPSEADTSPNDPTAAQMTKAELDAVRWQIVSNWYLDPTRMGAEDLLVDVQVKCKRLAIPTGFPVG